jgi:hypothetical protein
MTMTMTITRKDDRAWLLGADGEIISEIADEAIVEAFDADKQVVVDVRAQAASHYSYPSTHS